MLRRKIYIAIAVLCLCFAVSSQAAQIVIGDFEDGTTQGWFRNGSRPISVVADPTGNSNYMLQVDWGGFTGFDWTLGLYDTSQPALFQLANGSGPQLVEFDIYWDPSDWSGNGLARWTQIAYNYAGGWTQVNVPTSAGGASDRDFYTTSTTPVLQHPEWDFIANGTPLSSGTSWAQLFISTQAIELDPDNPITQGKFYIDNITITVPDAAPVPEPATMLLLASGLIGLAGYRRKFRK